MFFEASFSTSTSVDLRLHHDNGCSEFSKSLGSIGRIFDDNSIRNGNACLRKQLLGLIFVNLHVCRVLAESVLGLRVPILPRMVVRPAEMIQRAVFLAKCFPEHFQALRNGRFVGFFPLKFQGNVATVIDVGERLGYS